MIINSTYPQYPHQNNGIIQLRLIVYYVKVNKVPLLSFYVYGFS